MDRQELARLHDVCRRVVVVVNGKGGVCKTTTAANFAGQAADAGHRVLLADLDKQANQSEQFGISQAGQADGAGEAMFDAVARGKALVPSHPQVRPRLDLIGADKVNTGALQAWLTGNLHRPGAEFALLRALAPLAPQYDLIVLDLPPGSEEMRKLALAAARFLIVPTQADISSLKGLRDIADEFQEALHGNPLLQLLGILLVLVPYGGSSIRKDVRKTISRDFGSESPLFDTTIRHALAPAKEASDRGLLAHELEPFVLTKKETLERLKQRADGGKVERGVSSTAIKLSADWASFTEEGLLRIAESLADQAVLTEIAEQEAER
jgi:chromosome partitioning protein